MAFFRKKAIAAILSIVLLSIGLVLGLPFLFFDQIHILWTGGISLVSDVSEDPTAWFGYQYKEIYQIRKDLFMVRVDSGLDAARKALTPEGTLRQVAGLYRAPRTVEAYEKDPEGATTRTYRGRRVRIDVAGIVRAGTKIRCDKLLLHNAYNLWYKHQIDYTLYATILDGPYAGTMVDIDDISTFCNVGPSQCDPRDAHGRIRRSPDERILKRAG